MAKLFTGSIDLSKIDEKLIKTTDRNGEPFKNGGRYVNVSIWVNDEPDQYGNHVQITVGGKDDKKYISKNIKQYEKQHEGSTQPQPTNTGRPKSEFEKFAGEPKPKVKQEPQSGDLPF